MRCSKCGRLNEVCSRRNCNTYRTRERFGIWQVQCRETGEIVHSDPDQRRAERVAGYLNK